MERNFLVISPVYNEEKHIDKFYSALRDIYNQDIVFVDDGSLDKSKAILENKKSPSTFIIRHNERKGYGAALISGFNFAVEAGYKKIITLDVDLQHRPYHIPNFFHKLDEFDVALGSRYIKIDKSPDVPKDRFLINRYISNLIKLEFGWRFSDPFCGFRAYRLNFLNQIKFSNKGYGIALEILLQIIDKEARFCELQVEPIYFKDQRNFLDGLDDPQRRLVYYLEVISEKIKELYGKEKISFYKPSPR